MSARAGRSTGDARSMRRKTTPVSAGAGRNVMRTFWPVWRPTPDADTRVFSVRCRNIPTAASKSLFERRFYHLGGASALAAEPLGGEQIAIALLALACALFGEHPFGQVFDHAETRAPAAKVEVERGDLHRNHLAALLAV